MRCRLFIVLPLAILLQVSIVLAGQPEHKTLRLGRRTAVLCVPSRLPQDDVPLLLVFHGAGGNTRQMVNQTGFVPMAEKDGVLVLFLQGYKNSWSLPGSGTPATRAGIDDLAYTDSMVELVRKRYPIGKVYACGVSQGGFFAVQLACQRPKLLSGLATIAATIAKAQTEQCNERMRLQRILIFQGTKDRIVPYEGGKTKIGKPVEILGAEQAAQWWDARCAGSVKTFKGSTVIDQKWDRTKVKVSDDGCVTLYSVINGGHAWPGRRSKAQVLLGRATKEIDASKIIWQALFH